MSQREIPCVVMRGGTSKGPYFLADDLPRDRPTLEAVLLRVMGSPDTRQIDGIGGATTVTSKVAIVSESAHPKADIDYLFAQVDIERDLVDWGPTCGNILAGVGPFAIESGLVRAGPATTDLVVRNINTDSFIDVTVQTPHGQVTYEGGCAIAGVPGSAAPIDLRFREITGSKTAAMLPTGRPVDIIDGVEVTCIDVAMPMVIARAADMGLLGSEDANAVHGNASFMATMQALRRQAGVLMGLGDVSESVMPKFGVVAAPSGTGHFTARYLTPWQCHPAYAVSGSIATASAALVPGSVLSGICKRDDRLPSMVEIEHPSGSISVGLDAELVNGELVVTSGGAVRTARRLMAGHVLIPRSVWP